MSYNQPTTLSSLITVSTLIELSKSRLPAVANTLVTALENESKPTVNDEAISRDILHSQLFLLRTLSACMQHHWSVTSSLPGGIPSFNSSTDLYAAPQVRLRRVESVYSSESGHSKMSSDSSTSTPLLDPLPLEEALAKNILSIITRFMHYVSSLMEERDHLLSGNTTNNTLLTEIYTATGAAAPSTDIFGDTYKTARSIIFYLSASNWPVVFGKIKTRILFLATTKDENPETSEMRLLESCALNSKRLSMVMSELCSAFVHFKRPAQFMVAAILRRAIWGWIEAFPHEFAALCASNKRMEGGPELLFDVCNSLADSTKRKAIFWPLQTMLLILCQDSFSLDVLDKRNPNRTTRTIFVESLKKMWLSNTKPKAPIAAMCYVDLCRAASFVPPSPNASLRLFIRDFERDLKDKFFTIDWWFVEEMLVNGISLDHRNLPADCLVALFKLSSKSVPLEITECLAELSPILFKQSLVKACLAIASEETRLPWSLSVIHLYNISGSLRKLFIDFTNSDAVIRPEAVAYNTPSGARIPIIGSTTEKKLRKDLRLEAGNDRFDLILDMLRMYQKNPILALAGDDHDRFEQNQTMMMCMAKWLQDGNSAIRDAAAECLQSLHAAELIKVWRSSKEMPGQYMEDFWKVSSQVVFSLAKQLLNNWKHGDSPKWLLDLLAKLLVLRNKFLRKNQKIAAQGADVRERHQAFMALEVVLLVLLCSPDTDTCSASIECFKHLCVEMNLMENSDDPRQSTLLILDNLPVYADLSSNTHIVAGRKVQQKRIRRLLRMTNCTPGSLAAWEEALKRWRFMTSAMTRPHEEPKDEPVETVKKGGQTWHDKLRHKEPRLTGSMAAAATTPATTNMTAPLHRTDSLDDDRSAEWQNYGGFLSALGGICLLTEPPPAMLASSRNERHTPAHNESTRMVDDFVKEMVAMLLSDKVVIREWVKEILGTDLAPLLYPILFHHLEGVLGKCFSQDGEPQCSPKFTLFIELAIGVLNAVMERAEESSENLLMVDFGTLLNQYARYLNKLENNQAVLKTKIKFCQLCKAVMSKKEQITLRQEFKLRNKLLEIIVEWTSDFALIPASLDAGQTERIQRDLDLACLKTIVSLLHELPLQPSEPVLENDAGQIKSKMYYKYFTFFLKLLKRCKPTENKDSTAYFAMLQDDTILAMSNLLSANVDAGLKYSLSMGYDEDTRMRSAFMHVLTNILNQGTEFDTLSETVTMDRYEKIIDMLVTPDLSIALALCDNCQASDIDDVANALLACFSSRNMTLVLLKAVIEKEVQNTENETELFRRTSIATRLLSLFAKLNGTVYVRSVLQPVFQALAQKPHSERKFELDSSKLTNDEDVLKHKQNVVNATEMFLNAICTSTKEAPRSFRQVCHCILTAVRDKFPDAKYTAVGAFIFLRFFCPAIVSPESEGLVNVSMTNPQDMRRGYLIATKVIQNLANNVLFGAKETYMIVLNDFLTSNIYKVTSFLRDISNTTTDLTADAITDLRPMEDKDYATLHRVLVDNMERIHKGLPLHTPRTLESTEAPTAWKRQIDKLSNLVAQLGRPPEVPKRGPTIVNSYINMQSNQMYTDFMRRNGQRSVESIVSRNIFYEGGASRSGKLVFYFIARNVPADSINFELLVYHVLHTLERAAGKEFEVILDLTLFGPAHEVPDQWVRKLFELMQVGMYDLVANIHVYNPNTYLRRYITKLNIARPITQVISKKIRFAVTLSELQNYIHQSDIRLPSLTMVLDTESSTVFYPVSRVTSMSSTTDVAVKVGTDYIQVMTVRKQQLMPGFSTVTNDIFSVADIEDIAVGLQSHNSDAENYEFSFKYNKGGSQLVLSTPKRDAIIALIRQNKNILERNKPATLSERVIRPSDVPGRLLNMALLNTGSSDPTLRLASYNLLRSLSLTFKFEVPKQLLEARDLCLPSNCTQFIVDVSESIATTKPALTLEFLSECFVGFNKSNELQRYLCLDYMLPWLPNLALFCNSATDNDGTNLTKTKDVLRLLIDLTISRKDMYKLMQVKIWKTIGKIDSMLNLVLDVFVQVSNEHGIGSQQAEFMADTFVTLSNVVVRGKVISRLRKVLQRTSYKPTHVLTDHPTWTEIAVLIRFTLMFSFNYRGPVKNYVPEIAHIVSLVAGVGPTIIRASVHGLIVNMVQSLGGFNILKILKL